MSDIKQKAREMFDERFEYDFLNDTDIKSFIDQIIDLAIKEREGQIVEMIKSKGIFVGENRHLNKYIHEIINLITNSKE